jgi:two-component system, response regulator YesN
LSTVGTLSIKKRSRRFYKYFFSYILILVIVLIILGAVVYGGFITTLKHEVQYSNISALIQLQNTIDTRMKELNRTTISINSNALLKPYKMQLSGYDQMEAVGELKKYKSSNDFVYDIGLYHIYRSNQHVSSTVMDTDLDTFFEYEYRYENWGKDKFLILAESMTSPIMRLPEQVTVSGNKIMNIATYLFPLKMSAEKPYSIVMFFIDQDTLKKNIRNILSNYSGYVYILDEKNNPVVYINDGEVKSDPTTILNAVNHENITNGIHELKYLNKKYSVTRVKSDYNNWSYITVMQTDQFMNKVYTRRNLFNYAIFIVLIIGIIIAFALASGNYRPIRYLTNIVADQNTNQVLSGDDDEFTYIGRRFDEITKEKMALVVKLKSKTAMMRQQLLMDLLKGKHKDNYDDWTDMSELTSLNFNHPFFAVLLFQIDDYDSFNKNNDNVMQDLVKYSIINVIEELSQEVGLGYAVELVDNRSAALILNIKESRAREDYINELSFSAKEFFKDHFNVSLTVGVGRIYRNISMINESYMEASRAAYYRLIKGNDNIIFYKDIKNNQNEKYQYPSELEAKLQLSIKQGNSHAVEEILKDLRNYIKNTVITPEAAQCIGFGIINAVIKGITEIGINPEECFNDHKEMLLTRPFETVDDLGIRLTEFCTGICNYIEGQKDSKNYDLFEKINDIVNMKFMEHTICLENIASECGISPSYVSRFYKIQTGYPLMQYIDMLRMNEVKKMLKNSDLSLKDILQQVGYLDQSNFTRRFKAKEGVTPMQYRNISRMNSASHNE